MTRIEIPLPEIIRVVNTSNYKGSPRAVLLIDGEQVLYCDGHVRDEESYSMYFRAAWGRMFVRYLREYEPDELAAGGWSGRTDREIDREQYETVRLEREEQ